MNFNPEFVAQSDVRYPDLLKEIPNPPEGIYVLGELPEKQKSCIAIVGTRKATSEGKALAKEMAQKLSRAGAVIVSGLAMGIDSAAHEVALSANGLTVAV